ncbi:MAG: ABC transporter ATP-binding protein [Candidatus Latescibacterota bacterium]
MVRLSKLSFRFGSTFMLEIDELTINEGEILGIIGPNGAGKTTLLNIIALHEKPESGNMEILGEKVIGGKASLALRRHMSYVFSHPRLLKGTVYENVALPLRLRGGRDPGKVQEMLDLFGIAALKDISSAHLSQGQRHRVALARAFVSRPKLVLLDEPFLSLEERYTENLMGALRKAIVSTGSAVIFTTHNHDEALALADTIAVMKAGKVLQTGRPVEIFTRPVSKETAVFVGVRTILEGRIIDAADGLCTVQVGAHRIEALSGLEKGDEVFVCIRPEDVVVSGERESHSARNNFHAVITGIDPWGLAYHVNIDCGFAVVAALTRQSVEDIGLLAGQQAYVSFKATAIHLIKTERL